MHRQRYLSHNSPFSGDADFFWKRNSQACAKQGARHLTGSVGNSIEKIMSNAAHFSSPGNYRIEVQGHLRPDWNDRFGAMRIDSPETDSAVTVLQGHVSDQAELVGILNTLYELHLPLLSVQYLGMTKC